MGRGVFALYMTLPDFVRLESDFSLGEKVFFFLSNADLLMASGVWIVLKDKICPAFLGENVLRCD